MENQLTESKFRWLYLVGFSLILALPLLDLPPWFSPPDWGKTIVFRTILALLIFIFCYQILSDKENFKTFLLKIPSGLKNLSFWLFLALFGVFFLATIFSLDIRFSLWGSPYRSGGFVNFAFYFFFALLMFFVFKEKEWRMAWVLAIIVGILVSSIAIFQQLGWFKEALVSVSFRPPSTIGGPIFLALYLLLLTFPTIGFGLENKNLFKKLFYLGTAATFFLVIVFITQTRAAFIGLGFGLLYFFFLYPKKISLPKIIAGGLLVLIIFGFYLLKVRPEIYSSQNDIVKNTIERVLSITQGDPSRLSAWTVSFNAMIHRPVLGYGPENLSIGFDRYYDPRLPQIERLYYDPSSSWWDRAHNFVLDIGTTAGVPALIIYLSLFGVLFWQLQKLRAYPAQSGENQVKISPIVPHALQSGFVAYLTANFLSFDTFSSYLVIFFLIGYSLHLLSIRFNNDDKQVRLIQKLMEVDASWRKAFIPLIFIVLVWFVWEFNLKPFKINSEINIAKYYVQNNRCEQALIKMEEIFPQKSILDSYLRLKYVDFIKNCVSKLPGQELILGQKSYDLLKENVEIRPYFTRGWLMLGEFTNFLLEKETNTESKKVLAEEANRYFKQAEELGPNRQEALLYWIKTDLLTNNYQVAIEKSQKCINLNPDLGECYWLLALSQIFSGDPGKTADVNIALATERYYQVNSFISLGQLAKAYSTVKNYPKLAEAYQKLIIIKPNEVQYHAQLAVVYKELGKYNEAKAEALRVLELAPETKEEVELFLSTLPQR